MQYETVLLELLSRVQSLESELAQLKERLAQLEEEAAEPAEESAEESGEAESTASGTYSRVSDEMIEQCYQAGRQMRRSGESPQTLADRVAERTGMNRSSAFIYLYVAERMLAGSVYKRAISARATRRYLDNILRDDGPEGLRRALEALRQHVRYRRSCGHQVDSLEALCGRYQARL